MQVIQLPTYWPDYHPIALLWRATKRQASHHRYFPAFETLVHSVEEALALCAAHPEQVKGRFGHYLHHLADGVGATAPLAA